MEKRWDILGLGIAAVDELVYVDRFPEPDSKLRILDWRRQGGGLTATAMVAAARLGARAAYCSVLGVDELSRYTVEQLEGEGVDCSPVIYRPGAGPCHAVVIVNPAAGQRTILYSVAGLAQPAAEDVNLALIGACRVLCADEHAGPAALRACEIAHGCGIPSLADIEDVSRPGAAELLRQVDHLIVGVRLGRQATGESDPAAMVRALGHPGRACAVVTAGDQGCWYAERGGEVQHFPAFLVPVVDTTGCGDVFHGAYAAWLATGAGIPACIQAATAAAGLKAGQPGGRMGIPDRQTVERFLAAV